MITIKARSALLISQNTKHAIPTKTKNNTRKIDKHCTNCGMTNDNVETCKKKKEQSIMATTKATQPNQKTKKKSSYACHIYGLNGHTMTYSPKFAKI
jgi:hypothetical protein